MRHIRFRSRPSPCMTDHLPMSPLPVLVSSNLSVRGIPRTIGHPTDWFSESKFCALGKQASSHRSKRPYRLDEVLSARGTRIRVEQCVALPELLGRRDYYALLSQMTMPSC